MLTCSIASISNFCEVGVEMTKINENIEGIAGAIRAAYVTAPIPPIRTQLAFQEVDTAYEIQEANTAYWLAIGRRIVGCKTLGPGEFAPTLELKVNFIATTKPGPVLDTGRIVHRGRSICFMEGQLHDDGGDLLATATATSKITTRPRA